MASASKNKSLEGDATRERRRKAFKMSNSNFCRNAALLACGLFMLCVIVIGCSSPVRMNKITVSNEIVRANITNMPLVQVLAALDSALQQANSRYTICVFGTNSWNKTRQIIEYPNTKHEKVYTAPNMPLISFSSNYCTVEFFLKELEKQSAWCMQLDGTNDVFIIWGHLVHE